MKYGNDGLFCSAMLNKEKRSFISLLGIGLLGSIFRFAYAAHFEPWNQAPDQLEWELALADIVQNGQFSYSHLIHYPHEGGTILISLISLLVKLFTSFPSLVISAFLLDFLIRVFQLYVVKKVFGQKSFILFGLWTIFALPSLIPWAAVNFGLHSLSSVWPFIILLNLYSLKPKTKSYIYSGFFMALAICFSYINVALLIGYASYHLIVLRKPKLSIYSLLSFGLIMLLHLVVRINFDAGFGLLEYGLGVRGQHFEFEGLETIKRLWFAWSKSVPHSTLLPSLGKISSEWLQNTWAVLTGIGFMLFIFRPTKGDRLSLLFSITILSFLAIYAISPFYTETGSYVSFRHLSFILPALVCASISGWTNTKRKWRLGAIAMMIILSAYGSIKSLSQESNKQVLTKSTGWVLGTKFGHDPQTVLNIIELHPKQKFDLLEGIGWAYGTSFFEGLGESPVDRDAGNHKYAQLSFEEKMADSAAIKQNIKILNQLLLQYPDKYFKYLKNGLEISFSSQVKPRLDESIWEEITQQSKFKKTR